VIRVQPPDAPRGTSYHIAPMQSTGPDLTETTTAPREPTDAELPLANTIVAETTAAAPVTEPKTPVPEEAAPAPDAEASPIEDDDQDRDYQQSSLVRIAEGPPPEPARIVFSDLGLSEEVLRAIADMGYRHPTPIQEQAIPYVLMGRDVMGTAQTGTGKTAGFTLPMLDILSGSRARARMPRSLILEPTRELALQVAENFVQYGKYLKLTHALIIGGESMSDQKDVLNRGVDVLIATPGRLLDMFDRGTILLTDTRLLVIDEADRMLDMGFIPDVERIVSMLPKTRQTLFFSATMGPEIRRLGDAFLTNPKEIAVSRAASVATTITEGLALVAEHDKREALRRLIRSQNVQNALIFCNRKRDVDILYKSLTKHHFDAGALHGDMAQTVRFSTLEKFKANELRLLVCSDVAARGLDIGGLSHVFNFDVPIHAEDYVHRIGRTGRAGLEGKAFTIASPEDRYAVEQIEKLINHGIPPLLVEGLDPVDWAERDGRKRRGRKAAAPKKAADKKPREAKEGDEMPRAERMRPERSRPERKRPERAAQPELPVMAEERPSHRDEPRRSEPHRSEPHRSEPRRDDFRRERYRRDDDLGPAVVGFGDDVPAFMFLRARSPHVGETRETDA
jgi:superfamily II DNA/RNA helicase